MNRIRLPEFVFRGGTLAFDQFFHGVVWDSGEGRRAIPDIGSRTLDLGGWFV